MRSHPITYDKEHMV